MSNRKVKVGIVGCGGYGSTVIHKLKDSGRFEIIACADSSESVSRRAANGYGGEALIDINDLLKVPQIEAVAINTPVPLHTEHIRLCFEAGKHVFVAKPVTAFVADALSLKALAEARNLVFVVGQHTRYDPAHVLMARTIQEGQLGRICNVAVMSCSGMGLESGSQDWRADGYENPGGPLLQCGIHSIHYLQSLFGVVNRVCSFMQSDITQGPAVDNTVTLLEFSKGIQATIVCNYTTAYMHMISVFGTEANLHLKEHISGLGHQEVYLQRRNKGEFEPWEMLEIPATPKGIDLHGGVLEKSFAEQIVSHKPDYRNAQEAIEALSVVEAAVQSAQSGRAVVMEAFSAVKSKH